MILLAFLWSSFLIQPGIEAPLHFSNLLKDSETEPIYLPEATGEYPVGTMTYFWVDETREDEFTAQEGDYRQVIAQLFYPTTRPQVGKPEAYFPGLDLFRAGMLTLGPGRAREDSQRWRRFSRVRLGATREAPVADGKLPLVLFSPGGNMSRHFHSGLARDLASNGYIVAVLSHQYSTWDVFPGGGFQLSRRWSEDELVDSLAKDAELVLDRLEKLSAGESKDEFLKDKIELSRIAIVGHSRGGNTVARLCSHPSVRVCATIDNIGPEPEVRTGLRKPQIAIRSDDPSSWKRERIERLRDFLKRNTSRAWEVVIGGADHFSFTDLPSVDPGGFPRKMDPATVHKCLSGTLRAVFDPYLRRQTEPNSLSKVQIKNGCEAMTIHEMSAAASRDVYPGHTWGQKVAWDREEGFSKAVKFADRAGTAAYLLLRDGKIVHSYGDLTRKYKLHSIRKSLLSTLYGCFMTEHPNLLNRSLLELGFDDARHHLSDEEKKATIRHLLQFRSGVFLPAAYENTGWDKRRPERGSAAPGETFFYSNWDANAAGVLFESITGHNLFQAFLDRIARPINMEDFTLDDGEWEYERFRSEHPAYKFRMSSRDLARFGLLMARKGRWLNQQVVPRDWIQRITRPISKVTHPRSGQALLDNRFGYSWWVALDGQDHFSPVDLGSGAFHASGSGGHFLVISPALNLVFVHRVNTDLSPADRPQIGKDTVGRLLNLLLQASEPFS